MAAPISASTMDATKITSMYAIGRNFEKTIRPSGSDVRWPSQPEDGEQDDRRDGEEQRQIPRVTEGAAHEGRAPHSGVML